MIALGATWFQILYEFRQKYVYSFPWKVFLMECHQIFGDHVSNSESMTENLQNNQLSYLGENLYLFSSNDVQRFSYSWLFIVLIWWLDHFSVLTHLGIILQKLDRDCIKVESTLLIAMEAWNDCLDVSYGYGYNYGYVLKLWKYLKLS